MISDGTFDFNLRKPVEIAGCDTPVETIVFHECGEGYDSYYMKLRKFVLSGMMEAPELMNKLQGFKGDVEDDSLASGEEVKPLHQMKNEDHLKESKGLAEVLKLALGMSDDLEELTKVFGHMVSNNGGNAICTADGVRVKEAGWKRLHVEDKIDGAVQYCSFFGIGLDIALNNESETVSDLPTEAKAL